MTDIQFGIAILGSVFTVLGGLIAYFKFIKTGKSNESICEDLGNLDKRMDDVEKELIGIKGYIYETLKHRHDTTDENINKLIKGLEKLEGKMDSLISTMMEMIRKE